MITWFVGILIAALSFALGVGAGALAVLVALAKGIEEEEGPKNGYEIEARLRGDL